MILWKHLRISHRNKIIPETIFFKFNLALRNTSRDCKEQRICMVCVWKPKLCPLLLGCSIGHKLLPFLEIKSALTSPENGQTQTFPLVETECLVVFVYQQEAIKHSTVPGRPEKMKKKKRRRTPWANQNNTHLSTMFEVLVVKGGTKGKKQLWFLLR